MSHCVDVGRCADAFDIRLQFRGAFVGIEAYSHVLLSALGGSPLPELTAPAPQLVAAASLGQRLVNLTLSDDEEDLERAFRGPQAALTRVAWSEPGDAELALTGRVRAAATLRPIATLAQAPWLEELVEFVAAPLGLAYVLQPDSLGQGSDALVLCGPLAAVVGASVTMARIAQTLANAPSRNILEPLCRALGIDAWSADVVQAYGSALRQGRFSTSGQWLKDEFSCSEQMLNSAAERRQKRKVEFDDYVSNRVQRTTRYIRRAAASGS